MKAIAITIVYLLLLLAGQLLWKIGVGQKIIFKGSIADILLNLITSKYIIGGLVIYAVATVLWLYLLSKFDLNYIYPIVSLSFVMAALVSHFILKESVPLNRWVGVVIITIGVLITAIK